MFVVCVDVNLVFGDDVFCCVQIVLVVLLVFFLQIFGGEIGMGFVVSQFVLVLRWCIVFWYLLVGVVFEQGLQVKIVLIVCSISVVFFEICEIGGVWLDVLRWYFNGLVFDVMVFNFGIVEGIVLGNEIVVFVLKNVI